MVEPYILRTTLWLNKDGPVDQWLRNAVETHLNGPQQATDAVKQHAELMLTDWLTTTYPARVDEPRSFVHELFPNFRD